jgi:hypothetical protein
VSISGMFLSPYLLRVGFRVKTPVGYQIVGLGYRRLLGRREIFRLTRGRERCCQTAALGPECSYQDKNKNKVPTFPSQEIHFLRRHTYPLLPGLHPL